MIAQIHIQIQDVLDLSFINLETTRGLVVSREVNDAPHGKYPTVFLVCNCAKGRLGNKKLRRSDLGTELKS